MRYNKLCHFTAIIFVFSTSIFVGCSNVGTLNLGSVALPETGSPLNRITPLTFIVLDFNDTRNSPDIIGGTASPYTCRFRTDEKVGNIIAQAIAGELVRNKHIVLSSVNYKDADIVIEGNIYDFWVDIEGGADRVTGRVTAEISVKPCNNSSETFNKKYTGTYYHVSLKWDPKAVLKQAIINTVKEFTTDPDFLNVLKSAEKSKQ